MSDQKRSSGESFAGNVMKYSVATYLGFAITGLALIVKGLLPAEVLGAPVTFMTYTATIMNIGILGLDQALLRFYHEPPAGAEPRQLFAACTRISAAFMMLLGAAGSVFFAQPLAAAFGLGSAGPGIVPLLFLNAALYMLVRYLNVLLRLENDLRAYTAETLWMQGCYNLFYLLPGFFTSNVFVLAVAAILSFGVVAIAFGYKYRAAVFAPLPGAQLGGIARQTVPYGVALAPAQILFSLSSGICLSFVGNASGENAQGLFAFGYSLAQLVTAIQAGFSTYWGPYVYSHYRDEQERICRVHDVLNLLIFGFFCVLVMFEDIVFVIFPDKRGCLAIFPLLMLAVVFNILCEGTVYGNSIARKPWHDTIGIGLGALSNFGLCALLVPAFGLTGAALATAFCPLVTMIICSTHYLGKHNQVGFHFRAPSLRHLIACCQLGVSAFVGEISSAVIAIVFNFLLLGLAGNVGVAAYGVTANLSVVAMCLFNGLAQGTQPLISESYGKGDHTQSRQFLTWGVIACLIVEAIILVLTWSMTDPLIQIFNQEQNAELLHYAHSGLRLYFLGFLFAGINILLVAYFSAVAQPKPAIAGSLLRGAVAIIPCAVTLARLFGLNGVWLSFLASEMITFFAILLLAKLGHSSKELHNFKII